MLSKKQKTSLRSLAHAKKPVVMIGSSGLSDNIFAALEEALDRHELVKIKISSGDREERENIVLQLIEKSGAEKIQRIGNMLTLYRRNAQAPVIKI